MMSRWAELIELLRTGRRSVIFAEGLTDAEIARAEERYEFHFPIDLREFLQTALPWGFPFPDWRSEDMTVIREMMDLPLQGILFDVVQNDFWLPEWGPRPEQIEDSIAIVEEQVRQDPRLIPIWSRRMMPDRPLDAGNPVLSVHQTDIIHYGFDLDDYFRNEFELPGRKPWPNQVRPIDFWDVDRWQDLRWN